MKTGNLPYLKFTVSMIIAILLINPVQSQLRQNQLVPLDIALARKTESHIVKVNVNTLNDLMVKCVTMNITNVKFVFATIRTEDLPAYVKIHPEARGYEKELVGKQTILVMVEGADISGSSFFTVNSKLQNDSVATSIRDAGLIKLDKPIGGLTAARKAVYFEIGGVCPPPGSCD